MNSKIYTLACLLVVAMAGPLLAQETPAGAAPAAVQPAAPVIGGTRSLFVEVPALTEEHYAKLRAVLDQSPDMKIRQACIPAHILMLELPADNKDNLENNFNAFRSILQKETGVTQVRLLAEYSEESFMARCMAYRGGQP